MIDPADTASDVYAAQPFDDEPCHLCGAGPTGRCELPDDEDTCPHGCSPER